MQTIYLKKFGTVLSSRPAGLEAFKAVRPGINPHAAVQVDFDGATSIGPGWLDEFLVHLAKHANGNVELLPTKNASVLASLPILARAREDAVSLIAQRALERMRSLE